MFNISGKVLLILEHYQRISFLAKQLLKITDKNFSNSIKFLSLLSTIKNLSIIHRPYNERNIKDLPS